ncbi:hypothetical protein [Lentzea waywayandensis]|uniref:hypothetical protein n=1 Tax=Lentzea waywayandensis TaxID=84724 RepID=UPI0011602890|nr:hypothetical protein [Lentzea waywayandensis]
MPALRPGVHVKNALGMAAVAALSLTLAPAASAETGFATVKITRVSGWFGVEDFWTTRGGFIPRQKFDVDITNVVGRDVRGLSVFISLPTDRLGVTGYEGDGWRCWDVNEGIGAEGIKCTQDHLIVHEEAWPKLTVETKAEAIWTQDSIDVYAEADGHAAVHAQQWFRIDTST